MSIRVIILAAVIPLFILLAAMNGALFYHLSRSEMRQGLDQRALAAAVSGAEYLAEMPQPRALVDDAQRIRALKTALDHVADLDGYYWVDGDGRAVSLAPPVQAWGPAGVATPDAPMVLPLARDAAGRRYVVALAPAGTRGVVAARLDAEPLFARMDELQRWIFGGVALAALIGLFAGAYVARRIRRELDFSRDVIRALDRGEAAAHKGDLSIAEAADLADALRLVGANRRAAQERLRKTIAQEVGSRNDAEALHIWRAGAFLPVSVTVAETCLAVRIMGDAPMGSFFALCDGGEKGALVIGECSADTAIDALALSVSARKFIEAKWQDLGLEGVMALASPLFDIGPVECLGWNKGSGPEGTRLLAISDSETRRRAEIFAQADPAMAPDELLDGVAALLQARGVFAALRPV